MLPEASPLGVFTPQPEGILKSASEDWVCVTGEEGEIWIPRSNISVLVIKDEDSANQAE